jgi:riboflavin kinase/FMN adenylyltransferase
LNLDTKAEVLPATGVYVTRAAGWPAVTNVGFRPTFGGDDKLSIESFVLDGFEPPAPVHLRVEFLMRLREERRFPDPASLKAQILRDAARARAYFRRRPR